MSVALALQEGPVDTVAAAVAVDTTGEQVERVLARCSGPELAVDSG